MALLGNPPVLLLASGLLTIVGGLMLVSTTEGLAGLTLVLGGALLLFSAVGIRVHEPRPTRR